MASGAGLEALLKRDRLIILASLLGVTGLAWVYLFAMARNMSAMGQVAMTQLGAWSAAEFLVMFLMWAVMMVGMMLPSAAPMILLYGLFARRQGARGNPLAPVGLFAAGYLLAWTGFSLLATLLQWALELMALLSPTMVSTSPILGGALLIAAGAYQWTPAKNACLEHCRSPVEFLSRHWRKGKAGAVVMGLHHGLYCLGCCWFLMGLLFVGGVMNLLWIAAIAAFVLLEKAVPAGRWLGRAAGLGFVAWGSVVMTKAV